MIRFLGVVVFGALIAASSPTTLAVVITDADGTGNTTPPQDDPGFANVGILNVGSGIYLGNRWVLTAAHVGAGTITLNGQQYGHIPEETVRLENTIRGLTPETDILLMRLEDEPDLSALHAGCRSVGYNSEVTLVGGGRQRDPELSFWRHDENDGPNNDVWTKLEGPAGATNTGYLTSDTRTVRWGISRVNGINFEKGTGSGEVSSFQTAFVRPPVVESSAQAVKGDSGGAVFQKNGGIWELVGMIHAIGQEENQPSGTKSALFGGTTLAAELHDYIDQIREIADFEPNPGDFNGDGEISAADIDHIFTAVSNDLYSCHFDLTNDGRVNRTDVDQLLVLGETLIGDADLDGKVEFDDFLTVSRAFGDSDVGWAKGDFDGDRSVTFGDFLFLTLRFGDSFEMEELSPAPVPEPKAATLFLLGWLVLRTAIGHAGVARRANDIA